jgi:glutathione S-transferase
MPGYRLVIGNKNYSSWSLRPWLFLKNHGLDFQEVRLPLDSDTFRSEIGRYSPSGRVPVLHDGDLVVWDSLAIMEYLAERHPETRGWPQAVNARAHARAICAEMHSGFADMRNEMPMNCRRPSAAHALGPSARHDVDRVMTIWRETRKRHGNGGEFLFGSFTIADAMYAPVAVRFTAYGAELDDVCRAYVDAIYALPAMRSWLADAAGESESIPKYEAIGGQAGKQAAAR